MKKLITIIISLSVTILLLITPGQMQRGVITGLSLWYKGLIPALFPFMLLSNFIIQSGAGTEIAIFFRPIARIMGLPDASAYCIFTGMLFGYPSCAINSVGMVHKQQLDISSANLCVCCFNNVSPSFIIGFICIGLYNNTKLIPIVLILFYISILLSTIIIKLLLFKKNIASRTIFIAASTHNINPIHAAVNSIIMLGVYVIIFSIIRQYLLLIPFSMYFLPYVEVCNGIIDIKNCLPLIISAICFGGICGMFQTFSVDNNRILDRKKYICSKVIAGLTGFLITYIAVYVFKILN